jgi:quinol monooxygenase YgiN
MARGQDIFGLMSSVHVVATLHIRPGQEDEALRVLRELVEQVHAKDEGCIRYAFGRDAQVPRTVVFVGVWASGAAATAHGASPHQQAVVDRFDELFEPPIEIRTLELVPAGAPVKGSFGAAG